ncbi:MAG: 2-hydroxyacyl-CoA dehydratase family protein [Desulfotomaculales bacterium]
MALVGITTTIPVEIVYAAGWTPVDLNNVFIGAPDARALVEAAEAAGYPRNICAWVKGIYAALERREDIRTVIAVVQGDCSSTRALMETLELAGIEVLPFSYPYDRDPDFLRREMERLMCFFGVDWEAVRRAKERLDRVRRLVWELDELTWREDRVSGWANHYYQVCCSDFNGDPEGFGREVEGFLARARAASPSPPRVRLAYIGVPPIVPELYHHLEERGARVVFNETQRQFSMPFPGVDVVEQYRRYTYPYGVFYRLEDIGRELRRRRVQGVIHYVQSFCHRQIEDLVVRARLDLPLLTLEADRPGELDGRARIRLEAFLEMLGSG